MKKLFFSSFPLVVFYLCFAVVAGHGQTIASPQLLNHQGRIAVNGVNFEGAGRFKFALLNGDGSLVWSNSPIVPQEPEAAETVPQTAVELPVSKGLYSVLLGDTALANMAAIPALLFSEHPNLSLRVWFNDGSHGFQRITPDQRLATAPFAVIAEQARNASNFLGDLAGDVTGTQSATSIAATTVTGKVLTNFASGTGPITATDSILSALGKLDGNLQAKANLASPSFTGTVSGITAGMVGLGNVDNTPDADKPVSSAQQSALDAKANLASPTFTGTVSGITAEMVGLGNVDNTADADKPLSAAQQTALNAKANLASPSFTGSVRLPAGTTWSSPIRLANGVKLTNPVFGAVEFDGTNLYLTNNSASPTRKTLAFTDGSIDSATNFTGGLAGDVTGTQSATFIAATTVTGKVLTNFASGTGAITATDSILSALGKLDGNLQSKANLASPTFTGTVSGITAAMVGLGNVNNTADSAKPVSTAQQTALDLKADLASPTFTGTVGGITAGMVGLGNVNNTADTAKPVSTAQQTALDLKADLASPTFTGTVGGITAGMVGLGNVNNTADSAKPVSTAQQTALNAKANLASPTFTGTVRLPTGTVNAAPLRLASGPNLTTPVFGSVEFDGTNLYLTNNSASPTRKTLAFTDGSIDSATNFTGGLAGDVTGTQSATSIAATTVTGKALTNFASGTGAITATDSILSALGKLDGNLQSKANLASPTFTGTVSGITAAMVGLGNVNNTADTAKPVSTAQQTALNLKANLASPTFTGTVSGITKAMVGLGNVTNTNDTNKPVSVPQQAALDLKADLASPSFTGSVQLPAGTSSSAPLKLAAGTSLTTPALGAVEFDGTNLYLTTNPTNPTRRALAFSDAALSLSNVSAAPSQPVLAWGDDGAGQTTLPSLAQVASVAAGENHSLVLLDSGTVLSLGGGSEVPTSLMSVTAIAAGNQHDLAVKSDGTVVAWGGNDYGQASVPVGIADARQAAAGAKHSLILRANGAIAAWGDDSFGQITIPSSASSNVTAIAAGYDHSLALKSDGTVVAWGRNDAGQTAVPSDLSGVIAIAAGAYHSLAVKADGTVVAWGWDHAGQSSVPSGLSGVTAVAGGYAFSAALKNDGSVIVWGDDSAGQGMIPSAATRVTQLAAGASHLLALRADLVPTQLARLDQDNVFSGKVGIGRTPAVHALEVEGNASKTTASNWLANSDRRIKTEVATLTGALEKLDQVRLVDFRYTEDYRKSHPGIDDRRYLNVIAQEFAEVFPEHVVESGEFLADGSPILQVDTYPLTIYSAAAVQELHRENQSLKRQLADQEKRLRKLEALMENR